MTHRSNSGQVRQQQLHVSITSAEPWIHEFLLKSYASRENISHSLELGHTRLGTTGRGGGGFGGVFTLCFVSLLLSNFGVCYLFSFLPIVLHGGIIFFSQKYAAVVQGSFTRDVSRWPRRNTNTHTNSSHTNTHTYPVSSSFEWQQEKKTTTERER